MLDATLPGNLPTIAQPDDDPYLWLEEIHGEKALHWANARSAETIARFATPRFEGERDTLAALLDRPDKVPGISRLGGYVYNVWNDADNPRGLWRRTTLESYRTEEPVWDVLLDLDALAGAEGEDWVWAGASIEPRDAGRERVIISLSRGGSDASVNREYDLVTRSFVADGFILPEAKGGVSWIDRDTVLLQSTLGEGMATRAGYPRSVRLWRRGTDPLVAPVIFGADAASLGAGAHIDRTVEEPRIWYSEYRSMLDGDIWLGDLSGPQQKIDIPTDAGMSAFGDRLLLNPRRPYAAGDVVFSGDSLISISLSAFLEGRGNFELLFEPEERKILLGHFWNKGNLILAVLDNLIHRYEILIPSAIGWERRPIDVLPCHGTVHIGPLDTDFKESNGDILVSVQDPLTPAQLQLLNIADPANLAAPVLLKSSPAGFDASGLVVTRHEAISVDGVKIPYTQVGPAGETGNAPVHLYGYGGFGVVMESGYNIGVGKLWLEQGGTHVIANIRGGGEFGVPWHEAGRRAGKKLSHDDFAAVAADLVRRGVTIPQRIAAQGGSNGGLLIANMLTRYPEHFGALLCTVPVLDLRRFSKLLAGASWIDEFGDPDNPDDWAFMQQISAYHASEAGHPYPPILIATTLKDDRVHPGHARKMAAKLQHLGYPAHYYEQATGGHGSGKDNQETASFIALGYAFLRDAIGWTP
ncbi:prolyl oligopeptidase family serine peptidase [Phyllobacterium endophyticum]|uniref:prolyl oligopeptidase family serine peptidase n=1 Tax=Phyllobacterium endophyticum TaxID=1149773 RepID=UPI0011CB44DF|nr:prolyl oligopeptidase family serine peptidase [Phyllobacterium endophyticum]TXR49814.1 S9 family peptidase [Phyllobacterium endophyticum]